MQKVIFQKPRINLVPGSGLMLRVSSMTLSGIRGYDPRRELLSSASPCLDWGGTDWVLEIMQRLAWNKEFRTHIAIFFCLPSTQSVFSTNYMYPKDALPARKRRGWTILTRKSKRFNSQISRKQCRTYDWSHTVPVGCAILKRHQFCFVTHLCLERLAYLPGPNKSKHG